MTVADQKIEQFESQLLSPALVEASESNRLVEEYRAVITPEGETTAASSKLLEALEQASGGRRRGGLSLTLASRQRDATWPPLAGQYVMTPFYSVNSDDVYAAPGVVFWMRFNSNLHVFNHRYDNAVAQHRIEDVTRPHVLNHILNSFDFYKMFAFSDEPFPGYR